MTQTYIEVATGMELSEAEIRSNNPSTLFGSPFRSDEYPPLFSTPMPVFDPTSEVVVRGPNKKIDGNWYRTWTVKSLSIEQQQAEMARATEEFKQMVINNVQQRLDEFVQTANYDSVNSISKYQNISDEEIASLDQVTGAMVAKFRAEARYMSLMTAVTWAKLYTILAEVQAGKRPAPTTFAEIEDELPTLSWPT
jgi:hypothetical protein